MRHAEPPDRTRSGPRRRPGRILIVDDDPLIAHALARLLTPEHHVDTAGGGEEALALLRRGPGYDVILCDISMPDITGLDLHEIVSEMVPDQAERIVFVTGGITSAAQRARLDAISALVLEKPVDVERILSIVDDFVFGRRGATAPAE
jgi:two-component system, cell cycle sensor histidine kinase and response regulator CckA